MVRDYGTYRDRRGADSDWSAVMRTAEADGMFMAVFGVVLVALFLVLGLVFGVDSNGFSCPAGSQTVWEDGDDAGEIEGCILPGGRWMDDPD